MSAVIEADDCDEFLWSDDVTGGNYLRARDVARERVDLLALVTKLAGRAPVAIDDDVSYKAEIQASRRAPDSARIEGYSVKETTDPAVPELIRYEHAVRMLATADVIVSATTIGPTVVISTDG